MLGLAVAWLSPAGPPAAAAAQRNQAAAIATIVQNAMRANHLRAVIVRVTIGNRPLITRAWGQSLTGEPATTAMHFRNGAVSYS